MTRSIQKPSSSVIKSRHSRPSDIFRGGEVIGSFYELFLQWCCIHQFLGNESNQISAVWAKSSVQRRGCMAHADEKERKRHAIDAPPELDMRTAAIFPGKKKKKKICSPSWWRQTVSRPAWEEIWVCYWYSWCSMRFLIVCHRELFAKLWCVSYNLFAHSFGSCSCHALHKNRSRSARDHWHLILSIYYTFQVCIMCLMVLSSGHNMHVTPWRDMKTKPVWTFMWQKEQMLCVTSLIWEDFFL